MSFQIQTGTEKGFNASVVTGWLTVTFKTPFAEGVTPTIFAQVQTRNGKDTPGLRLQNISNTGFDVRMEEVFITDTSSSKQGNLGTVKSSQEHPVKETLGWMAIAIE